MKKKAMTIELSNEKPFSKGYFYASLELPATEYEIRDALQQLRQKSAHITPDQISVYDSKYIPQLDDRRLDAPTIDELNFLAKRLVSMDEDEMAKFLTGSFDSCPYFQNNNEYEIVKKQI